MPFSIRNSSYTASHPSPFGLSVCTALLLLLIFMASSGVVQWGDNGGFLVRAASGTFFTPDLQEMSHPLYTLVSSCVVALTGAWGLSYFNPLLLVLMCLQIYALGRQLSMQPAAAMGAVLASLGIHSVLWVSTKVEVYVLHLVLVLACFNVYFAQGLLQSRRLRAALLGFLTGLAISTHQLTFVVLAPMAVLLLAKETRHFWAYSLGAGLGLFACIPGLVNELASGRHLIEVVRGFLTGGHGSGEGIWESKLFRFDKLMSNPKQTGGVLLSFMGVGLFGLFKLPRDTALRLLWVSAWLNLLFAISYDVFDSFTFVIPGAVLAALLGVHALSQGLLPRLSSKALYAMVALPMALTHAWPVVLPHIKPQTERQRYQLTYFLAPLVKDDSASKFVQAYESVVPKGAIVFAEWHVLQALLSAQQVGRFENRDVRPCYNHTLPDNLAAPIHLTYDCPVPNGLKVEKEALGGWRVLALP